jgi:Uma2 family endonuclease
MALIEPVTLPPLKPPPRGEDLPWDFGEPMESKRHGDQMNLLIESLDYAWQERTDYFVAGNMAVYYSETQSKKNDFRGPDLFVVLDTEKKDRKSWVVWEEDGRTPDVVIELLSETTEKADRGKKMRIYARLLKVGFYYLFDPFTGGLEGYELDLATRTYHPLEAREGRLACRALGLSLGVVRHVYRGLEMDWLRWIDEEGKVLPHGGELAEAEAQRAEAAEERAEAAEERAEAEARRASEAEKKLADLEAKLAELERHSK